MSDHRAPLSRDEMLLAAAGIVLMSIGIRNAVSNLSPLFEQVGIDIAVDHIGMGLLGSLPTLCFGAFGLVALQLRGVLRLETMIVLSLLAIAAGQVLRALASGFFGLFSASALLFAGMGVANITMPPAVRRYFPRHIGLMTAVFTTGMTAFAFIPAIVAVPLADQFGWRFSIGSWAFLATIAVTPWLLLSWRTSRRVPAVGLSVEPPPDLGRSVWRSRTAWALAVLFAASSANIFGMFAWLPEFLVALTGVSSAAAGALLGLYGAIGAAASLSVPVIAERFHRSVSPLIAIGAVGPMIGYFCMIIAPSSATLLWVAVIGLGWITFPLALYLVNQRSRTAGDSIVLSGFMQGVGYLLSAGAPLIVGVVLDATGSWNIALLIFAGTAPVALISGFVLARPGSPTDVGGPAG